ncbi:DNA-3-methyladenine glycosylase 2 family protein [Metabacillus sp. KIGAM252]|uniref:DNA-3-methyladenine glycosylase II n=1 Tax=Metabacillus flavus TaxID=2823519 RepID=A0ABS5LF22_9BACI|nr:DNA-3-methyladenine glycosylase [Metabacillus flavus]MBS2969201.1 DNA-3-methyladenine glycosylase 2 family protein [Metabacillus flavus]
MTSASKDMHVFNFSTASESMIIQVPKLFSCKEALHYLTRSPQECLHQVVDGEIYKVLVIDRHKILVRIKESGHSFLELKIVDGSDKSEIMHRKAAEYTAEWLDLTTDLEPFYQIANNDPILGSLTQKFEGLRIIGVPDLFEALTWAVIGQQINLAFAYTLKKRLVEAYGEKHVWAEKAFWTFPAPETIASLSAENLRELQFTEKKAEYVIGIAKLIADGKITKENLLRVRNVKSIEEKLLSIRGIGPWTAHYCMMRCLRISSSFPFGDAALNKALQNAGFKEGKLTRDEMEEIFSPWAPWEAYAVFYFWKSLS